MKCRTILTIDKSFRDLIKSHNYEKYVFNIITRSQDIFRGFEFTQIEEQSHGESDFKDNNDQYYDAKLLIEKKQGELIGDPRNTFDTWMNSMLKEKIEFGIGIQTGNLSFVKETKLYKIMKDRLDSVEPNEHAIFFIPFPIVDEHKGSYFMLATTDFLQAVYEMLVEENLVGIRKVYFIYPSGDPHEYVLRDSYRKHEYIMCDELDDFIRFENKFVI